MLPRPLRNISLAAFGIAVVIGSVLAPPAAAAEEPPGPSNNGRAPAAAEQGQGHSRFVVKFRETAEIRSGSRAKAYGQAAKELGVSVKEVRTTAGGAQVLKTDEELSAREAERLVGGLQARRDVEYAEPDVLMRPLAAFNDTFYDLQWDLHEALAGIRAPGAWDTSTGDGSVVAVVDTGITAHSDLMPNILPGYDMISDPARARDGNGRDANPQDEGDWYDDAECGFTTTSSALSSWHGTHVAGTVAAVANNGQGVSGVAPGAKILPVRALGSCGGYMSDISDGITWATGGAVPGLAANSNPADVVNLSVGGPGACSATMQGAISEGVGRGAAIVVAAGNENQSAGNSSPANCRNVITVAASDRQGNRAPYSNYGSVVDVAAPGGSMEVEVSGGIASTYNTGSTVPADETYAYSVGTSMAAPHVAGLAALMMSVNEGLTPQQVEEQLKNSARPLPGTCAEGCGAGLIDAAAAVKAVLPPEPEPVPEPAPAPVPTPSPEPTPPPEPDNSFITAAPLDLDQNSSSDLLSRDSAGNLWFHAGTGKGSYAEPRQIGSGWNAYDLLASAGTFDGDDYPDLLARRTDGSLWLYPGAAGAQYAPAVRLADSGWDGFDAVLGAGDLDGDGHNDVIARQPDGSVYLYAGDGSGGLAPRVLVATGWQALDRLTATGDFTGDGKADLVGRKADGTLWLLRSTGSEPDGGGLFDDPQLIGASGWQAFDTILGVGDNNGDGRADLLAVYPDRNLRFYAGTAFSEPEGYLPGTPSGDPVWDDHRLMAAPGDFNGDGKADLLATRPDGTFWFAAGDGKGGYGNRVRIGTGWHIYDKLLGAGDYDGDGSNDLIARQPDGSLWFYAGTGSIGGGNEGYERRVKIGSSGWGQFLHLEAAGDVNGDGNRDLLAVTRDGTLYLYAGPGTGTSHGPRTVAGAGWNAYTAVVPVGDYDGDGTGDAVLRKSDGSLWLRTGLKSPSGGWFSGERKIGSGGWNGFDRILGPGDFNADSKVDIFATRPDGAAFFYAGTQFRGGQAVKPGLPAGNL